MRQCHSLFRSLTMEKNGHASTTTKKNRRTTATIKKTGHLTATMKKNGHATAEAQANGHTSVTSSELRVLLSGLQAMRDGDFSVRLPGDWTGLEGKIADTFNEIVATNQKMAQELQRVGQVVGKEGKTRERARFDQ